MKIKFIEKASEKMEASKLTFSNLLTEKEQSIVKGGHIPVECNLSYFDNCGETFSSSCFTNDIVINFDESSGPL